MLLLTLATFERFQAHLKFETRAFQAFQPFLKNFKFRWKDEVSLSEAEKRSRKMENFMVSKFQAGLLFVPIINLLL